MRRTAFLGMIFLILTACGPAVLPEKAAEIPGTPTPSQTRALNLIPLNDPSISDELDQLRQELDDRTTEDKTLLREWHSHPVVLWNAETRDWVAYYGLDPVVASRIYALMSIAQQRTLDEVNRLDIDYEARMPKSLDENIISFETGCQPFECAALLGAAETVLIHFFPDTDVEIVDSTMEARTSLLLSGTILPSDLDAAEELGRLIAEDLIAERLNDGSVNATFVDSLPKGDGVWRPDPFRVRPEMPGWSKVTPWLLDSADQFRAPPPPEFGSPEFDAALDEVRQTMVTNTARELNIALIWADKRGTYTPPGHWNAIAAEFIERYQLPDQDASRVFAALNMAVMDAGIACWDSKYHYMVVRPWQADPSIPTLVGQPNHPSYPSGHSCFSGAGAETLSYFFPADREELWGMAEESSISRLYGGIHYSFDLEAGKAIGRQVGLLAQAYALSHGWMEHH